MKSTMLAAPLAVLASFIHVAHAAMPAKQPKLRVLGTYESGLFNVGGAEIPAYDPVSRRAFMVNAGSATVDVLDLRNPKKPTKVGSLDIVADLAPRSVGAANSVDVRRGMLAVAVEADPKQDDGWVAFYSTQTLELLAVLPAGALPDMVTFSEDGRYVLAANEGEPDDTYTNDPEGTVGGARHDELPADVRIYGPGATVAQDLEPEYITTDGETAWVTLQENNAIAVINIHTARVKKVFALGAIRIRRWPVFGMYQPDSIANFEIGDKQYLITANEGDTRDYDGYSEEERVADLTLDPTAFPNAAELQEDANLGRLTVTTALGDADGDGDFDRLYVPGGRSFSIWNARTGALVFDSGAELEQLLANLLPGEFNANHEENDSLDNRSDNKGPEPEGLTLGVVNGRLYAFVGLERIGGVLTLDLSDPRNPEFVDYVNNRQVPRGKPLLIVGNEVSGTTTVYEVR